MLWGFRDGWADCAGGCSWPLGWANTNGGLRVLPVCTEDWPVGLSPLFLSVCAAFAYLYPLQASGCWCVEVVCTGGCECTCSPYVPVFGVCWVYSGLCWLGLVSVDADVFRCDWCDRSRVGLGIAV